jgi:transposase
VLRLLPYHPDLNPIELIWVEVKWWVRAKNTFCINDVISVSGNLKKLVQKGGSVLANI